MMYSVRHVAAAFLMFVSAGLCGSAAAANSGPLSPKVAVRCHSLKHGLTSKQIVLPGEDPAACDELRRELHDDYAPANTAEATLVDQIAEHTWRLQRVRRAETAIERSYHRPIDQLRKAAEGTPLS